MQLQCPAKFRTEQKKPTTTKSKWNETCQPQPAFGWKWNACLSNFISGADCCFCFWRCRAVYLNLHKTDPWYIKRSFTMCMWVFDGLCYSVFSRVYTDVWLRKCAIVIHVSHSISGYGFPLSDPSPASYTFFSLLSIVYAGGFSLLLHTVFSALPHDLLNI